MPQTRRRAKRQPALGKASWENFAVSCANMTLMTAALSKPMTIAAFLDWEERQPLKYEFDGFRAVAMTGGTAAHAAIQRNLAVSIGVRLRGRSCHYFGNDLKIGLSGRVRYPDGFVVCSAVPPRATIVYDPVVIFEVLSDSSARTDLVTKNHEYSTIQSVRRCVVLSQDERAGTMFERIGDDWVGHLLAEDFILRMPEIGIEVPLAEIYEGVEFGVLEEASDQPG
jgi:Uma2 family endonuclease